MTNLPSIQAWDQYPDETGEAYRAFDTFKKLPPAKRDVENTWKAFQKFANERTTEAMLSNWMKRFHWLDRASAWDAHLITVGDKRVEKSVERDRMVERATRRYHLNALSQFINAYEADLKQKVDQKKDLEPTEIRGLAQVIAVYAEQSRKEYNDYDQDGDGDASDLEHAAQGIRQKIQQDLAKDLDAGETTGIPAILQ